MFPIICHGCGQRGKVASIPADLACRVCKTGEHLDLDERTAGVLDDPDLPMLNLPTGTPDQDADFDLVDPLRPVNEVLPPGTPPYTQRALGRRKTARDDRPQWWDDASYARVQGGDWFNHDTGKWESFDGHEAEDLESYNESEIAAGRAPWTPDKPQSGTFDPWQAKRTQITRAVLASNPGMTLRTASRVANQTIAKYPVLNMDDVTLFERIGYESYSMPGKMRAPMSSPEVAEAIRDKAVGHPDTTTIMRAYTKGWDHAADEAADSVSREGSRTAARNEYGPLSNDQNDLTMERGTPITVGPDFDGSTWSAKADWVYDGPTRHPYNSVIRDRTTNTTVHCNNSRISPRSARRTAAGKATVGQVAKVTYTLGNESDYTEEGLVVRVNGAKVWFILSGGSYKAVEATSVTPGDRGVAAKALRGWAEKTVAFHPGSNGQKNMADLLRNFVKSADVSESVKSEVLAKVADIPSTGSNPILMG